MTPRDQCAAPSDADAAEAELRKQYVVDNLDLVDTIARSLLGRLPPCFELSDLIQEGRIGLIDAAKKYSRAYNVNFRAYAKYRIRGEILESVRRRRYTEATMPGLERDHYEMPGPDKVVEIQGSIAHQQIMERVDQAMGGLTPQHRVAIREYYYRDKRLAGVGAKLGVKEPRSSQILRNALESLRTELRRQGITPKNNAA